MRVALVTPRYLPHVGGVESHVRQIANHLAVGGDEVDIVTFDASPWSVRVDRDGPVRVRRFPSRALTPGVGSPMSIARYLRAHGGGYDILHIHNYQSLLPLAALAAAPSRLVVTPHYHGTSPTRIGSALRRIYRPIGAAALRRADRVICVSRAEMRLLVAHLKVPADRLTVIPNGVDPRSLRAAEPFPVAMPVVLSLGRLDSYKRVDRTMEAMTRLRQPAQLVVVGDGPMRPRLERLAAQLGLSDAVHFVGRVDDHEVHRWLATSSVVVTLSEIEAFGLTVVEGLVTGSRVVASDIPAHREVAETLPGAAIRLLAAGADPARVADALDAALAEPGPAAPVEAMDWAEVARRTRDVYVDALASPRRRPVTAAAFVRPARHVPTRGVGDERSEA